MTTRLLVAAGLAMQLVALPGLIAVADSSEKVGAATLVPTAAGPPKIVADAPLAEPLSRGVVFINHRVEHLLLAPAFGPKAVEVSPAVGHLHITLDGAAWGWGLTSGDPVIIFGLPAGPHKVQLTLANANHQPLDRQVVEFVIPPRDAAAKGH